MNLKKLLCLLLALVMVLSLAACSDSDSGKDDDDDEDDEEISEDKDKNDKNDKDDKDDEDEEPTEPADPADAILGSWITYIYMTAENTGLDGFSTDAGLPVVFTFEEDGTATMAAYEEGLEDAIAELEADLCEYMVELMYTQLEASGYTREDVDTLFSDTYGMSLAEYAEASVEEMGMYDSFMEINESGDYTIDGNVLKLDGQELTFEVDGDILKVLDSSDPDYWEELGLTFPVEMERVG